MKRFRNVSAVIGAVLLFMVAGNDQRLTDLGQTPSEWCGWLIAIAFVFLTPMALRIIGMMIQESNNTKEGK